METVKAGTLSKYSGLIQCTKCGKEIVMEKNKTVPPCQRCGNGEWVYIKITDPGK